MLQFRISTQTARLNRALAALLLALVCGCALRSGPTVTYPEGRGTLVVEVVGFHSDGGQAIASLFSNDRGFPDAMGEGIRSLVAPIEEGLSRFVFTDVSWGEYAVSVLHDENGDGRMQSSWLGIPREGHGVSNNPESRFGPPAYEQARFVFLAPQRTVRIKILYLDDRGPGSQRRR